MEKQDIIDFLDYLSWTTEIDEVIDCSKYDYIAEKYIKYIN